MSRIVVIVAAALLSVACSRDPEVLKKRYLEAGDRYFAKGKFREASIMYRTAVRKDPRFGLAYYRNALALLKSEQFGLAEASLRRAVELLPEGRERVSARVQLADIYLAFMKNVKPHRLMIREVETLADELVALDPKSFDGLRIRGTVTGVKALEIRGTQPAESGETLLAAIADLKAADSIQPFKPEVVTALTRALWANNQTQEAERYLKSLLGAKPDFANGYWELSRFYAKNNRLKEAEEVLIQASRALPKQFEFAGQLAELYQRAGRNEEMAATLRQLKKDAIGRPAPFELAGNLYLKAGQPEQAIREYETGIADFPDEKIRFRKLIIAALMAQNKKPEAARLNDEILREHPEDPDALARQAEHSLEAGDINKAIASLEAILRRYPNHPPTHFSLGRAMLAAGRQESARFHYSESIRWAPEFIPPRLALAQLEIGSGEFGKGVASTEAILGFDEKNREARLLRSIALRGMGKLGEARAEVNALLAMDPRYDEALFQLGAIEAAQRKWKEAEAAYQRSYQSNPANIEGLLAIADLKMDLGQPEAAVALLRSEVEKKPDRLDLRLSYGTFASRVGKRAEAAGEFNLLLEKLQSNPQAVGDLNLRLGDLYYRTGDARQALPYLEKAKQLRPGDPAALHSLGVAYDMLGRKKEAAALYEESLRAYGRNPVILNNLAYYISQNGGDLDRALTLAQRARQTSPGVPAYADTVACIYLKKNLVDNALEILEDLVSKNPDEAVFRLHLGEALIKKGDTARARKELLAAQSAKTAPEDAARIRELLAKPGG